MTSDQLSYAVSASLTQFLLSLDSKPTFVRFTVEGKAKGWDTALSRYYGIRNVRELQARWQNWTQGQTSLRTVKTVDTTAKELEVQSTLVRHRPTLAPIRR